MFMNKALITSIFMDNNSEKVKQENRNVNVEYQLPRKEAQSGRIRLTTKKKHHEWITQEGELIFLLWFFILNFFIM